MARSYVHTVAMRYGMRLREGLPGCDSGYIIASS